MLTSRQKTRRNQEVPALTAGTESLNLRRLKRQNIRDVAAKASAAHGNIWGSRWVCPGFAGA